MSLYKTVIAAFLQAINIFEYWSYEVSFSSKKKVVLVLKDQPKPKRGNTSQRVKNIIRQRLSGLGKPSFDRWVAMSPSDRRNFLIYHRDNAELRLYIENLEEQRRATLTTAPNQSMASAPEARPVIDSINVCCVTKPVPIGKQFEEHLKIMELLERND